MLDDHVVFGILEGVRRPLIRPTMQLGDSLGQATDEHGDPLQHRRRHKNSHRINTETASHASCSSAQKKPLLLHKLQRNND